MKILKQLLFEMMVFISFVDIKGDYNICDKRFTIKSDLVQEDCLQDTYYKSNLLHECLPNCVEVVGFQGFCENDDPCPPGYKCENNACILNTDSCLIYDVNFGDEDAPYNAAIWKPTCLKDGTWAAKQCKGEDANGRCFCYDSIGNRIFGHAWSNKAENMTCACSRKRSELQKDPSKWFITLHCDEQGNYEPLQCTLNQCWCVEPKTGKIRSQVVPETMMKHLPCYSKETVGSQYLRQCESQLYAQAETIYELETHGTKFVNFPSLVCADDGSYGKFKVLNGITYCTWKDNTGIGSYQPESIEKANCNCAYDSKLFESIGQSQNLKCTSGGSYDPVQKINELYFCVDSDGFTKSKFQTTPFTASDCEKLK